MLIKNFLLLSILIVSIVYYVKLNLKKDLIKIPIFYINLKKDTDRLSYI